MDGCSSETRSEGCLTFCLLEHNSVRQQARITVFVKKTNSHKLTSRLRLWEALRFAEAEAKNMLFEE